MSKKAIHAAIIEIPKSYLLELLDFDGGTIHDIRRPQDEWKPDTIEIVMEHPDLDRVEEGCALRRIYIAYNFSARGVSRVEPPKKARRVRKVS